MSLHVYKSARQRDRPFQNAVASNTALNIALKPCPNLYECLDIDHYFEF